MYTVHLYNTTIIQQKGENELVHKFYSAQKLRPVKNDFVLQIQEDLLEIEWEISEMDAMKMSKLQYGTSPLPQDTWELGCSYQGTGSRGNFLKVKF